MNKRGHLDPSTSSEFEQRRFALHSGIVLFVVAGLSAVLGAAVTVGLSPGVRIGLFIVGSTDLVLAGLGIAFRRARWTDGVLLIMVVPALAIYGYGNYSAGDSYRAALYLIVIAMWVGISQRRGVNLALTPLYAVTFWLPLSLHAHPPTLNQAVPYVVIVAVASGETVAWLTSRLASVTDRLRSQDQRRFAALDEESSDVTMVLDQSAVVTYVSASICPLLGYRADDIEGSPAPQVLAQYMDPDGMSLALAKLEAAMASPMGQETFEAQIRHIDGTWRHVEVKIRNLLDDDVVGAVLLDLWDVTDREQARASLEASEESFRLLFQLSPLPTMVLDPAGMHFVGVNDAACAHYGYSRSEFLTMTIVDVLASQDEEPPGGFMRPGLWKHRTKDRRLIDVEISVNRSPFAEVDAYMVLVVDVTEQRFLEEQLRHQALHDSLTGLANRALLEDRLGRALAASTRVAQSVALLSCDLDGFKMVNDRLGHGIGDRVLGQIASRLNEIVRPGDTVARFGGDEFAVVVELINDPGGAQALAERIIAALAQPIFVDQEKVHLSVSIGIAFGTSTIGAEELSRSADAARSQAKAAGKNCYRVFEVAMRAHAVRRLELTNDLRAGLDQDQFRLQYQPHVALSSGAIEGFEALVRWAHPTYGMIQPLDFIPLAEESGLIVPLGRWVLETACQQAASWPCPSGPALTIAVNLSARQLRSSSIVDDVRNALALSGLDPARLVLEVTESVLMEDTNSTMALIEQLKAVGVGLAIDDFGTGYSSLSYLRQFDFDVLKIDKSFVDALNDRPDQSAAFIRTIVSLGHTLGMQIVAEGVETSAQFRELVLLGSDSGQGYLMSRPLDPDASLAFLARPAKDYANSEQFAA
jgi:diguanylate cyclase (GGDEF)-like protein/PAS domain S-box-containing protein